MQTIYQPPAEHANLDATDPGLLAAVARGEARLTPEQALALLEQTPTFELGRWADARCRQVHGDRFRTYVIDRNINYTNVCTAKCTFCAFRRDATDHDAYTLEYEQLFEKIAQLRNIGGTQILMQGGMNPELGLDWYIQLLHGIKERFPGMHVHGFSPPEFIEFVDFFNPPGKNLEEKLRWVMVRLQQAGLDSLPGGGGEIFAPAVRRKIGLGKCDAEAWLTTMYVAHSLGMYTSATMMFGHIEGHADRIHHMKLVRDWQDKALRDFGTGEAPVDVANDPSIAKPSTGGHYVSFISWPFQPDNTPLGRCREWPAEGDVEQYGEPFPGDAVAKLDGSGTKDLHPEFGRRLRLAGATSYLRTQATSRLFLDNIYSIGSSWVTMGPHIGQVALMFGANDMGSVMMEENVVSAAGTTYCLDEALLCRLIRESGFTPAQRDNTYDVLRMHTADDSPDLRVTDWSQHRAKSLHKQAEAEHKAELTVSAGN
ncbi:MAG: cyclic dehypoxanthine futalosine synthase [Phycisphaeraceae bacterium]|nr:MAG: cyclic dehypoxanthine futalosine synthase [Phycisphaeraceae bacterium]